VLAMVAEFEADLIRLRTNFRKNPPEDGWDGSWKLETK
jgi:hypothetical protein